VVEQTCVYHELDAQTCLQGFYLSLGFQVCRDEFLEDEIPRIPMRI
jgi:predicted GNAT family N-acyltransferase